MKKGWIKWLLIGAASLLALILVIGYSVYRYNLKPVNSHQPNPVPFSIDSGERTATIAKRLQQAGIIRSRQAFSIYITIHGLRRKIEAGYYELSAADSAITNAKIIARGIVVNKAFLVKEGQSLQQIEDQALQTWLHGSDMPQALTETYDNSFLTQRPTGASLEGYLFPDTYEIAPSTTAHQLVQSMLNNFGQKVTPQIIAGISQRGLNLHQGLTLASIIQSETGRSTDMPIVAQIFYKRLSLGMKLESSVTAQYGAHLNGATIGESQVANYQSPYNTYIITGLPPGPISNPGLDAIKAVVSPANTNYLYFIADKEGVSHFETTFAEHQADVAEYLSN